MQKKEIPRAQERMPICQSSTLHYQYIYTCQVSSSPSIHQTTSLSLIKSTSIFCPLSLSSNEHVKDRPSSIRQCCWWHCGPILSIGIIQGVLQQQRNDKWVRAEAVSGCHWAQGPNRWPRHENSLHTCMHTLSLIGVLTFQDILLSNRKRSYK